MSDSEVGTKPDREGPPTEDRYFYLSTLARGLSILELLAEEGYLSASEVARILGFNRTSSHRYLATLKEKGYVKKDEDSRYALSYKIFELGTRVENLSGVIQEALPSMHELAAIYNETVNLACLDGLEVIHLEKVVSTEILRIDPALGSRAPAHCTALGKSILAFLPMKELRALLNGRVLKAYTANTITEKETLLNELEKVRDEGVAIDNEELAISSVCVGAPILDRLGYPRYAISVSGVSMRMTPERVVKLKQDVRDICKELSSKFMPHIE